MDEDRNKICSVQLELSSATFPGQTSAILFALTSYPLGLTSYPLGLTSYPLGGRRNMLRIGRRNMLRILFLSG